MENQESTVRKIQNEQLINMLYSFIQKPEVKLITEQVKANPYSADDKISNESLIEIKAIRKSKETIQFILRSNSDNALTEFTKTFLINPELFREKEVPVISEIFVHKSHH